MARKPLYTQKQENKLAKLEDHNCKYQKTNFNKRKSDTVNKRNEPNDMKNAKGSLNQTVQQ